jgi:Ser/Thr protein kinase RdoA (MazF antagonist)
MNEIPSILEREVGTEPTEIVQIHDGFHHETYAVQCGETSYILQCSDPDEQGRERLRHGLNWYLRLQESPISVPEVVTETPGTLGEREYTLVEKIRGESGELAITPERVRNAGQYLATIHAEESFERPGQLQFENGGPTVSPFEEGSVAEWREQRLDETLQTFEDWEMTTAAEALKRVRPEIVDELPTAFQSVLCHNDFSPDNLIFVDDTVTGVIDFDLAYAGHSHRDIVKAANGIWMHDPGADWDVRETFYEGYRTERPLDDGFDTEEPRYRVGTLASTIAGMLDSGGLSAYEQDFYTERIVEAVERLDSHV